MVEADEARALLPRTRRPRLASCLIVVQPQSYISILLSCEQISHIRCGS